MVVLELLVRGRDGVLRDDRDGVFSLFGVAGDGRCGLLRSNSRSLLVEVYTVFMKGLMAGDWSIDGLSAVEDFESASVLGAK